VPLNHRAAAIVCDRERPPAGVEARYDLASNLELATCSTDAECTVPNDCQDCRAACVKARDGDRSVCIVGSAAQCLRDADCTEGDNGRCEDFRGFWQCTYDECFTDGDCSERGPCQCEGGFWSESNACLAGNCRTDSDCGPGGYCSPTFGDCGNYAGVIAYYCHTPDDRCMDDEDCMSEEMGPGYCMYRPELSHWVCGYGQCVG
jgi:hypothetical protein